MRLWVNMLQSRSFLYWVWPNPVSPSACLCVCFACVCKQPADSRGNGQVLLHLSLHFSPLESNISLGSRLPSYNTPGSSPSTHTHTHTALLHLSTSAPCTSTCVVVFFCCSFYLCVCIFKSLSMGVFSDDRLKMCVDKMCIAAYSIEQLTLQHRHRCHHSMRPLVPVVSSLRTIRL